VNSTDVMKKTALHWAADYNQAAAIEFLLAHGADPSLRDNIDETALMKAKNHKFDAAVKALKQHRK